MPSSRRGRRRREGSRRRVRLLEPALLLLLHHGPSHAYVLLERLGEFGVEAMDASIVYRALRDMEGRGWVQSTWDEVDTQGPPRRVYRLTSEGDQALAQYTDLLAETRSHIEQLLGAYRQHMREGQGDHH